MRALPGRAKAPPPLQLLLLLLLLLLRLPAAAQAALLEDETGRRLLEDVYPASFFWPARDIVDGRRLTTLTDVELETLCELQEVWAPEEHGRNPPDEEFARRFQDTLVLLPLPLPCRRLWKERRSIARLAVLNASVLCYSDSFSPASMSYYHDMDKYESVRFLEPLQWLGTNSDEAADELRAELLGGAKLSITAHVDPDPWKVEFDRPLRHGLVNTASALFLCNVILAIVVMSKRRIQGRNKTILPSVVLVSNILINLYKGIVVMAWNGARIKATMPVVLTRLTASGCSGMTAGNDLLLVIFWKRLVEGSFGPGSARLYIPAKIIVLAAINCYFGDVGFGVLFMLNVPERVVYSIGGAFLTVFQTVALVELNQSVRCVIRALESAVVSSHAQSSIKVESAATRSQRLLLERVAFLIKVATFASVAGIIPPLAYMISPFYHADSPAVQLSIDILGFYSSALNHVAQILVFWPVPRARRNNKVRPKNTPHDTTHDGATASKAASIAAASALASSTSSGVD